MKSFDNGGREAYEEEVKEKWGKTAAYKEYAEKTKNYTKDKRNALTAEMNGILAEFSERMKNGEEPGSAEAQILVKKLQDHITENYYHCTDEILAGLGRMYTADERFKNNIDKNGGGTAEYIGRAIEIYCGHIAG
ncbi:MAG: TipAS antibiotic-recognition domain-containing protein [Oscillospiraceae bacterium]|nr:TipAS antibiotic-recognition domain-containing protein [Oscillospiraceae bacterium]